MKCPECGSVEDWIAEDEGRFAHCEFCGFTKYSEWTRGIMAEVRREQLQCKKILGYVPTYSAYLRARTEREGKSKWWKTGPR